METRTFCPSYGLNLKFPPANCNNTESWHWVLLAKGFLDIEGVIVFDSINFKPELREHVINCLCLLEKTDERSIHYWSSSCQRQSNGFDCDGYAIAFAVSLAFRQNPLLLTYDPKKLRAHLKSAFYRSNYSLFHRLQAEVEDW